MDQRLLYLIKFGLVIKKTERKHTVFKKLMPQSASLRVLYYKEIQLMIKTFLVK